MQTLSGIDAPTTGVLANGDPGLVQAQSGSGTTIGSAPGNFVLSGDATKIFVAGTDGVLRIFDSTSGALLGSTALGTHLGAIDISPDGSYLLITEQQPASYHYNDPYWPDTTTESLVYKVSTATYGTVQTYHYQSTGANYTLADVAITAAGKALFTENILPGWSGWTPMVSLDLATGVFTSGGGTFYQSGSLTASPDRTTVLHGELYLSAAEAQILRPDLTQLANNGIYENGVFGYATGVEAYSGSGANGHVAISTGGQLHLWNGNFGYLDNLTTTNSVLTNVVGLHFSADGQTLYAWNGTDGDVYGISMSTYAITETLSGPTNYSTDHAWGDELVLSPDDGEIFLSTTDGIVRLDHPNIASGTEYDDIFSGLARADIYTGLGGNDIIHGNGGADTLSGGPGNDSLYGDDGNDTLNGGTGNDLLDGGHGADIMSGGANDDSYVVDNAGDTVYEAVGEGMDRVVTSVSWTMTAGQEIEQLTTANPAGTDPINLTGNDFANKIAGNDGANTLIGGGGNDKLAGGGGDDLLDGGTGADQMAGGTGSDSYIVDNVGDTVIEANSGGVDYDTVTTSVTWAMGAGQEIERLRAAPGTDPINLTGNDFAQKIMGNDGANILIGNGGNDNLIGNGGDDVLIGGTGLDKLTGGAGADRFVFEHGGQMDQIVDFTVGVDKADLTAFGLTWQQVQAAMTESNGNTILTLGGGDSVVFAGVAEASLSASDFLLGGGNTPNSHIATGMLEGGSPDTDMALLHPQIENLHATFDWHLL